MRTLLCALVFAAGLVSAGGFQDAPEAPYTFGATVVDTSALEGRIFYLEPDTQKLPDFRRMQPVGAVYANSLNVWPQSFTEGFPGITDRFEWFAIEYTGKIWIEKPGFYRFSLLCDDGGRLKLNNKTIVSNDGVHGPSAVSSGAKLTRGAYEITVEYFQGPRVRVALVVAVAAPAEAWRIFDMRDFRPPGDLEQYPKGKVSDIQDQKKP